jgi:hypothetical protein
MRRLRGALLLACLLTGVSGPAVPRHRHLELRGELAGRTDLEQTFASLRARRVEDGAVAPADPTARRAAVDGVWGEGLPTAQKLKLFDRSGIDIGAKSSAVSALAASPAS